MDFVYTLTWLGLSFASTIFQENANVSSGQCQFVEPQQLSYTRSQDLAKRRKKKTSVIKRLSTSINCLPPEILGHIFIYCVGDQFLKPRRKSIHIILCLVCRYWKDVTQSIQSLWSSISLTNRHSIDISPIQIWLARSGESPLTIKIKGAPSDKDLQSLLLTLDRWQHILVDIPLINDIHLCSSMDISSSRPRRLMWRTTPPGPIEAILFKRPIDWSELTELHLVARFGIRDCYNILQKCPMLKICYFESVMYTRARPGVGRFTALNHENMRSLRIESVGSVTQLLASLTLPNLLSLTIEATHRNASFLHEQSDVLADLFSRSSSVHPLQNLVLEQCHIADLQLIQVLSHTPSLTKLEIFEDSNQQEAEAFISAPGDTLLDALGNAFKNGNFLCPRLKVIKFKGRVQSEDGQFSEAVFSRWKNRAALNNVDSLKEVQVDFGDGEHSLDMSILRIMRFEGLNVYAFSRNGTMYSS